jgi:hypothetical protein
MNPTLYVGIPLIRKLPVKSVDWMLVYSSCEPAGSFELSCQGKIIEDRHITMNNSEHRDRIKAG